MRELRIVVVMSLVLTVAVFGVLALALWAAQYGDRAVYLGVALPIFALLTPVVWISRCIVARPSRAFEFPNVDRPGAEQVDRKGT
jgi:hypothetical protein